MLVVRRIIVVLYIIIYKYVFWCFLIFIVIDIVVIFWLLGYFNIVMVVVLDIILSEIVNLYILIILSSCYSVRFIWL